MLVIFLSKCQTHHFWVTGLGKPLILFSLTSMVGVKGECFLDLMTPAQEKKKQKQKAIGERAGEKCPEHGAKVLTASVITKSKTESECC